MTDGTRNALIIAAGIVLAVSLYIYFSPYQTCVRALGGKNAAKFACAAASHSMD